MPSATMPNAFEIPCNIRRLTVPSFRARKGTEPIAMLTAYTARMAELLDDHCDALLVGDSLAQAIYGLPSTVPVTLDMMIAHGQAVVRGSKRSMVIVDMPFGSYEASLEQAFLSASRVLKETGADAVKLEGGATIAPTIAFLTARGIPVMGHVGVTIPRQSRGPSLCEPLKAAGGVANAAPILAPPQAAIPQYRLS